MAIGEEIPKTNPAEIAGDEGIEGVDRGAVQQMSGRTELPEHVRRNRVLWDAYAAEYAGPGEGELIFLTNSVLLTLCAPEEDDLAASDRLLRPAFEMYRIEWPGDMGVEFHLSHGDWFRLLRRSGFEVEDLIEVRAPEAGTTRYPYVTLQWARQWPSEEIWKARRRVDNDKL